MTKIQIISLMIYFFVHLFRSVEWNQILKDYECCCNYSECTKQVLKNIEGLMGVWDGWEWLRANAPSPPYFDGPAIFS